MLHMLGLNNLTFVSICLFYQSHVSQESKFSFFLPLSWRPSLFYSMFIKNERFYYNIYASSEAVNVTTFVPSGIVTTYTVYSR